MDLIRGPSETLYKGKTRPVDFVRHGSTALNDDKGSGDRIRGWQDIPLDDRGMQEAQNIAKKIASLTDGRKPQMLFSSDLQRSSQTAQLISQAAGIPLGPLQHGLRPWNLGQFQGMESAKIAPQMKMFINNPRQRVPGGESFSEFFQRFITTFRNILRSTQGARIAIISHHRNERLLSSMQKAGWVGFDKMEFTKKGDPPGALITFEVPVAL